jgi:hypothetical protein
MTDDRDFWEWLWEDDPEAPAPPPRVATKTEPHRPTEAVPEAKPSEQRPPPVGPTRARRRRRGSGLVTVAAAAVAAAAVILLVLPRGPRSPSDDGGSAVQAYGNQQVVTWTVWDDKPGEFPFVAVLAAGGGKQPAAVAVPTNTAVNIPGHNFGTVEEAADAGDVTDVAATMENVLGVRVDGAWGTPIGSLRRLVDDLGGIQAGFERLDGPGTMTYLRDAPDVERDIRWEEVLDGFLSAIGQHPDALGAVPASVRSAFVPGQREVVILPVEDVGAGLVRPDDAAVADLVTERFVPTGSEEKVRLVVLNGNGIPGIGKDVARILVPEGFTLVASQNLTSFDQQETQVVASSSEFLPAAHRAQRLLGVGSVYRTDQPTYLADVTVIVGKDFMPDDAGGP